MRVSLAQLLFKFNLSSPDTGGKLCNLKCAAKKVIISERDREIAGKPSIYPSLMPEMVKESKSSFIHS